MLLHLRVGLGCSLDEALNSEEPHAGLLETTNLSLPCCPLHCSDGKYRHVGCALGLGTIFSHSLRRADHAHTLHAILPRVVDLSLEWNHFSVHLGQRRIR